MIRRLFKPAIFAAFAAIILCLIYGFAIEPKRLVLRDVVIESDNWSGPDLTIGLATDIHIGGIHVRAKRALIIADALKALEADIILMPGDFINGHDPITERSASENQELETGLTTLSKLRAPLGVYASIGNHDDWYDAGAVTRWLEAGGTLSVLDNRAVNLERFCLVGLADAYTGRPDFSAFSGCEAGKPVIVLTHSPDALPIIPRDAALVVTGHTHGGQINLPIIGRAVTSTKLGKPYAYGTVYDGPRPSFISAGIGTSILPARFRAPPEIVKITLRASSGD